MTKKNLVAIIASLPLLASCNGGPSLKITNIPAGGLLEVKQTYTLEVKRDGIGADVPLVYTTSDETVASIDQQGVITANQIGKAKITVTAQSVSDSFDLQVTDAYVQGKVTDQDGQPIANVHISTDDGRRVDTGADGSYPRMQIEHDMPLYFEKAGYLTYVGIPNFNTTNGEHILNVVLQPRSAGKNVTVTGTIKNIKDEVVPNVSVIIRQDDGYRRTTTDEHGEFTLKNIYAGSEVEIKALNNEFNEFNGSFSVSGGTCTANITMKPYQEEMIFLQGGPEMTLGETQMIIGHTYRNETGITFELNANFEAFNNTYNYRICVDACDLVDSYPNHGRKETGDEPETRRDIHDFDIEFNKDGEIKENRWHSTDDPKDDDGLWVDSLGVGVECVNRYQATITIPYAYPKMDEAKTDEEVFGIYFAETSGQLGKCKIYGHDMTETNQLSYIRIDLDNNAYAASNNGFVDPIFKGPEPGNPSLNWETDPTDETDSWQFASYTNSENEKIYDLGLVGNPFNYGYNFRIAKRLAGASYYDTGIYFLAKMDREEMNNRFLENSLVANFFIDAEVSLYNNKIIDGDKNRDINRFGMVSNYEVKRSYPTRKGNLLPFEGEVHYLDDDVYGKGVRYYSRGNFAMLYIPYEALYYVNSEGETKQLGETADFGVAPNLNYKGTEWYHYNGDNPTGYHYIDPEETPDDDGGHPDYPHFECRCSYIHLDGISLAVERVM